jgi:hypothetical protein
VENIAVMAALPESILPLGPHCLQITATSSHSGEKTYTPEGGYARTGGVTAVQVRLAIWINCHGIGRIYIGLGNRTVNAKTREGRY